jgi:hypothetical protein
MNARSARRCIVLGIVAFFAARPALAPAQQGLPRFELTAKLAPPTSVTYFGQDVDVSGDVLVAGARDGAFVFERSSTGSWNLIKTLAPPPGTSNFGWSVSVDGDLVAVGAPIAITSGPTEDPGSVFVYDRNQDGPGSFGLLRRIDGPTAQPLGEPGSFGASVALDGDKLAVTSMGLSYLYAWGMVHVYERHLGGENAWGERVRQDSGICSDGYGYKVRFAGDVLLVAASVWARGYCSPQFPVFEPDRVYAYVEDAGGPKAWGEVAALEGYDRFGRDFSMSGDTLVVADDFQVHHFERHLGGTNAFGLASTIPSSVTLSAGLDGSLLATGRYENGQPRIAVYRHAPLGGWTRIDTLKRSVTPVTYFGNTVAMNGRSVAVPDVRENLDASAVYVFEKPAVEFPATPLPRPGFGVRPP